MTEISLTKEELHAIAHAISFAWEQGAIRNPQLGFHLLSGSDKIHQEWQRRVETNNGGSISEPQESTTEAREMTAEAI